VGPASGRGARGTTKGWRRRRGPWRGLLSPHPRACPPRINYPTIDSAVELLAPSDGETVIEIGSGDGRGVHSILRRCTPGQLHAVEWHETYIQELRADPLLREKKVQLHECDARSLPVPDGSADKVLAVNCVYFLEPLDEYFRELYRVLKPGGSLLVAAKFHLVKGVHDPWAYSSSNPFIHTEAATVAAAMRAAGFKASNAAAPRADPAAAAPQASPPSLPPPQVTTREVPLGEVWYSYQAMEASK